MPLTPALRAGQFNTTPASPRRVPSPIDMGGGSFVVGERAFNPMEEFALSRQRDAMQGLREAAGLNREMQSMDRASNLADAERFGLDEADVLEDIADFRADRGIPREDLLSEAKAGREFGPFASELYRRNRGAAMEDFQRRYVDPAIIGQEATLGAAELKRQGDVESAAITGRSTMNRAMLQGLLRAIEESIAQSKGRFDPENVQGITPSLLQQMFGGGQ